MSWLENTSVLARRHICPWPPYRRTFKVYSLLSLDFKQIETLMCSEHVPNERVPNMFRPNVVPGFSFHLINGPLKGAIDQMQRK